MTIQPFNVLLLGAGAVNFGTEEGPWCHTRAVQGDPHGYTDNSKLGQRLNVVGIVEPDTRRADAQLEKKRSANVAGYALTKVFASIGAAAESFKPSESPRLVVFGIQPLYRGGTQEGRDAELQVQKYWPHAGLFIEKPISNSSVAEVRDLISRLNGPVSIGYMLRYLKAVRDMKHIIEVNELQIKACIATYIMAYEWAGARGLDYFDLRNEPAGPIVTQATHFVDLCRYLCGEADLETVTTLTVTKSEPAGQLTRLVSDIPEDSSIPRVTDSMWKWNNGGVCTLVHAVALHDGLFDAEIVLIADGWKLRLVDPYGTPQLHVREPGKGETVTVYNEDDPFFSEISTIVDVVEGKAALDAILSPYVDALKTYQLVSLAVGRPPDAQTRAIRDAGDTSAGSQRIVG